MMPEGEEFYLAPIALGYYRFPDLLDGTLSIEHLYEINDAIAFAQENQSRVNLASRTR